MKFNSDKALHVAGALVLLLGSVVFGLLENAKAMGLAVLAGAIAMAFANLDRLESFHGAGFGAKTRPSDAKQRAIDEPDTDNKESDKQDEGTLTASGSPRSLHAARRREYREVFLAHEVYRTKRKKLPYDVIIYIRGAAGRDIAHVDRALFFLGKIFSKDPFEGKNIGANRLGVIVQAHSEFFCTCQVSFSNPKQEIVLDQYIDFGMLRALEGDDPDIY